jgi:hypothetical protein
MRSVLFVSVVLLVGAAVALAQQQGLDASAGTNRIQTGASKDYTPLTMDVQLLSRVTEDTGKTNAEVAIGKKLSVGGPLISTVKVKKASDVPRRVWSLINPFAPTENGEKLEGRSDLSPRAWASTVGFHPGSSAFPDATTHEPTMAVLSVHR